MAQKNNKKEVKHLFGTSEKSDFILNMDKEGAQKMCGVYSIISILLLALMTIPGYFLQNVVDYVDSDNNTVQYLSESFIFYTSIIIILMGIVGYIIFAVAHNKKLVSFKDNKALLLVVGIVALSAVSTALADEPYTALMGYLNRNEGLLTILCYWGVFAVAMCITADNRRLKLADFIVGIGAFESIVGILQAIPATAKFVPNYFENLFAAFGSTPGDGQIYTKEGGITAIFDVAHSSSGFMSTPFALSAALSVMVAVAFGGFVFEESKKRKLFYGISALAMVSASILSQVVAGLVGAGCAVIFILCTAVIKAFCKNSEGKAVAVRAAAFTVCVGIIAGVLFGTGAAKLYDEQTIYTDGYVRLSISYATRNGAYEGTQGAENSDQWIYPYLWDDGMYVTEQNLLFGTGQDNWGTMIEAGSTTDRCYNEYIDCAQQRGIFCVALYTIFVLVSLVKMIKLVIEFAKGKVSWLAPAFSAGAFAYLCQAFFNISSPTGSPYLYLALGIVWSYTAVKQKEK